MSSSYLRILYEIRKLLIDYCDKKNIIFNSIDKQYKKSLKLTEDYDIYELNGDDNSEYHGITYVNIKTWISYKNGIKIGGKVFISLLKALQITSKVLKEKIDYNTHVTLDKKYVQYSGDIVDMGIRKLS